MTAPEHPASPESLPEASPPETARGLSLLGTLLLLLGSAIIVAAVADRAVGLPVRMPRSWYHSPLLWYALAAACVGAGIMVLRRSLEKPDPAWRPERPGRRFERLVIYTRPNCHLCDVAKDTLMHYRRYLPGLEEVNIESDPALVERFGTEIPVVEIDGRVRFRGRVDESLLRRLIEGTSPK